ncbi:sensor histidine kinase [Novipirellula artificiosorum]|uniref:histidine kinase n=1 Tax=Novipirellula artificiosorum TaxID=2528016 RepID=A0A5C6DLW5_9BACT|nr:HAMP domain-containing sensor histidine kinase [Novipirellula artificiosorum]TWU35916.1 Sensor protein ZraS [Novipirellula artificiosorum]
MRLAAKLILLFLVGLLLIVGLFAYLTIRNDRQLALAEHERYASDLAAALKPSLREAIQQRDAQQLQQVISRSTSQVRHMRIRLVEFDSLVTTEPFAENRKPLVPRELIVTTKEVTTVRMPDPTGTHTIYTYVPLVSNAESVDPASGISEGIEISAPDTEADARLHRSLLSSIMALLGVATLSGVVILIGGVAMVGRPLHHLIEKVERVGNGDFGDPIKLKSNDELGGLATAINTMCDQLANQRARLEAETESRIVAVEQLRHSDRLSSVGRLAAGVAHEIGTPLNVISGRAELIAAGQLQQQVIAESAMAIQSEAHRITKTIRELLDFARQSTPDRSAHPLGELIEQTVSLAQPLAAKQKVRIDFVQPDHPLIAEVDASQMQQVLMNLIVNAIHSIEQDGTITISLSHADSNVGYQKIAISDNGSGICEQDKQHIFEPFFTTKDIGQGTGLGLSISHGIVQEHGGRIEVESELGAGSCFTIYLPAPSRPKASETEGDT